MVVVAVAAAVVVVVPKLNVKFDDDDFVSPPNDVKPDCLKLILLSNNFHQECIFIYLLLYL